MDLNLDNLEEIYQLLVKSQNDAATVVNCFDFQESIDPTPEKRQQLNILIDHMSAYLMEVSHVNAFLQWCDVENSKNLTAEQQALLIQCQILCQSLKASSGKMLKWVVTMKSEFDEASCPIFPTLPISTPLDEITPNRSSSHKTDHHITSAMMETYHQARDILEEIHKEFTFLDPENMTHIAGRRLQVMEGKNLFLETEHEMNVFMDYCIFQYYKDGKNIVQRYYDLRSSLYSEPHLTLLTALKNTQFSFLEIIHAVNDYGLLVHDPLTKKDLLMIDKGLCQVSKRNQQYAILTHYLCLPEFVMTTGASTPILLTTDIGKEMQAVLHKLVLHHQEQKLLDDKSYKQCITDLYKIAIHSDALKTVASRELPFNYHQLHKEDIFVH